MSDVIAPVAAVFFPYIGGFPSGSITRTHMRWYESLKKPPWCPPNNFFSPVWMVLYGSMGYASYLTWRDGRGFDGAALPLALYSTQLALNWAWTPIFFSARSIKWALIDMVCLWGAIAGTTYLFHGINQTASYLMLPYLGWVSFASALVFNIWRNNPDTTKIKE
ncbi:translocator protein-like [Physella acuta]|uniref:translocator protein-like n=1 Tax=Physella acuta TaxID=109671 RepID=UPI0027DD716D|nr:translocator protein-like [Physella acuta]XP_059152396.1 translocator protein-like [Physella acuta]